MSRMVFHIPASKYFENDADRLEEVEGGDIVIVNLDTERHTAEWALFHWRAYWKSAYQGEDGRYYVMKDISSSLEFQDDDYDGVVKLLVETHQWRRS